MFGEEGDDAVLDPATLPELHGEVQVARKRREKAGQRRELDRSEVRAELNEDRTELVAEQARALGEEGEEITGISQAILVGDLLREA